MMTTATIKQPPPMHTVDGGRLKFHFHKHQKKAMRSRKRFVLLLAGTQGGKTSFAQLWLWKEIKSRGAGDYLFVAPTYKLMNLKAIPEFLFWFSIMFGLGEFHKSDKVFVFSKEGEVKMWGKEQDTETRILFGHAQDPDSLESATAKAAVLDECGQKKFKLASFEAIMRRLSLAMGRVLMCTTPYYLGWLKQKFWDVWQKAGGKHPEIDVIRFPSIANPAFPIEEYNRAKQDLPRWKFDMFYNAIFTRPAGMIYDCFDEAVHKIKPFAIGDNWKRYLGLDFGGVNTAAIFLAEEPTTGNLYAYREYKAGGRTAAQHTEYLLGSEKSKPIAAGGSKSEGQWRDEFRAAGLHIAEPRVSDVEVGINRVYGAIKNNQLFVFDTLEGLLDEFMSYSRELDDTGQPTEAIEDKNTFHHLDALRYIVGYLRSNGNLEGVKENPFFS